MYLKPTLFLIFLFSSSYASAQQITASPEIREIKSFGHWGTDDYEGNYRIVIINKGFEHVSSNVYIEWISSDNETYKTVKSILVSEVSGFYSVRIKKVDSNKAVLYLVDSHSFEKSEVEIEPTELGKYKANSISACGF